jgi:hypothetical protein
MSHYIFHYSDLALIFGVQGPPAQQFSMSVIARSQQLSCSLATESLKPMFQRSLGRYPLVRRAVLALIVNFCFHAAVLESRAGRQYREVSKWPMTQAIISSGNVYSTSYSWSGKQSRFCPQLTYKYTIKSRDYAGSNRVFDFTCWPDAYDFIARHQPGSAVTIAYDPTDASISFIPASVRDPGYPWGDVIAGIILAALLAVDLFGAWTRQSEPRTT